MNGLSEKDNELLDEDSLIHLDHFFRDRLPIIKTIGDGDPLSRIAPVFHKMFVIQMILDDQFMIDILVELEIDIPQDVILQELIQKGKLFFIQGILAG